MTEYLKIVLLAAAQGVAEFLPISSSGHLLVLGNWFGFDAEENLTLNVVLHAGTLLAILVFYFRKLWSILADASRRRLIGLVIVGSIPAGVIGVGLKKLGLEAVLFSSPWAPAVGFVITASMILYVFSKDRCPADEGIATEKMSFMQALGIGAAQAIAIAPGISRSGSTIAAGRKFGLRAADAAEFSFLLAIPAIGGAALLEGVDMVKEGALSAQSGAELGALGLGFVISAAVGYASLAGLIAMLRRGRLTCFAWYLYFAAAVTAAVEIVKMVK